MALVTVSNLSRHFDGKPAVDHVDFTLQEGQTIALIGPNGAGKTTILRTMAGLLKPTEGSVTFRGMKQGDDIRSYIGYLPQYPAFYNWMTGMEFLTYSGELALLSKNDSQQRAHNLLEKVGIADAKGQRIGKYSGGMKQRLGIAQAMIHQPKLLMLDEPVSSLDPIGRRDVLTLMEELKQDMTILFSTHILSDADEVSDELLLLNKGQMVESGSLATLRKKYQTTKLELSFDTDPAPFQTLVNQLDSVENAYVDKDMLHVIAHDIEAARAGILTKAAAENWPLTYFSINRASLEDMFMRVVTA
ncbi:ABC transporter ATP-binding protein uup-1 [Lentibacillus sp. JNUCC-1]|uniref:ABC transporter ATP-binding protein n=1 Tax=Lentibacillus sp. JNUCC-1 TaxID=2654513 RepID=UPI0012E92A31|nr:ABC transporter ATP-binding protein [Lentibacillus sp. JNUCC-1]MUV38700.1 ABC transporter ATP-binding protein uup-1 [Lentibacillus sp. JNUCC-1]